MSENLIELIILRHGEAGSAALDQERPLTDYGRQQIAGQYQWLQEHQFEPELILHSPYRRTTETADLASVLFPNAELQVEPLLTPDGDPVTVSSMLPAYGKQKILIASHMPMVSYLTAKLLPEIDIFSYPVAGLCWFQLSSDGSSAKLIDRHSYG